MDNAIAERCTTKFLAFIKLLTQLSIRANIHPFFVCVVYTGLDMHQVCTCPSRRIAYTSVCTTKNHYHSQLDMSAMVSGISHGSLPSILAIAMQPLGPLMGSLHP
jgi:hypothetical protein